MGLGLGDIVLDGGREESTDAADVVDIITFIESSWGLGMTLYPVQKVILKAHYGLGLDESPSGVTDEQLNLLSTQDLTELARVENPAVEDFDWYDEEAQEHIYRDLMVRTIMRRVVPVTDWKREEIPGVAPFQTEAEYLRYLYANGRCNIKEVIAGEQRREMILSVGRRSGKCVTGGTLVLTDEGIQRIEDLGDPEGPEVQPLTVGVVQEANGRSKSAYFYNGGVKPTVGYETRCGYKLEGTENHRVRVMGEDGTIQWRYLGDLQVGDQIAVHRTSDLWTSDYLDVTKFSNDRGRKNIQFPEKLTERWGLLLGALVGDGGWTNRTSVSMTIEHHETWMQMFGLFSELLGEEPSVTMDQRTENTGSLRVHSVAWREFLHEIGFNWDAGRYDKSVPWSILQSPKVVVCAFLQGLFETDGGVESNGKVVSFSTASGRLAREVQTLLTNMGIVSRVKAKWNSAMERHYYLLNIRGLRSRQAFADQIGFLSEKKMAPLLASLEQASREGGDTESIPHQKAWVRKLLHSVPKAKPGQGWSRSTLRKKLGNTCKPSSEDPITYPRLHEALRVAKEVGADDEIIKHFEYLQAADYFFDPVVEMWEGEEHVFDLNVPDGASFVANGMTNHNTTISACIAAYETYILLSKGNPQAFYGLPDGNTIQLISVATDKDQAGLLYRDVAKYFAKCEFFRRFQANSTQSFARFQTPADIERHGAYRDTQNGSTASINVTFRSCIAKGLRGAGNIVVILDEVAHFTDGGQSSADAVYQAVKPSISAFSPKNPDNTIEAIGEVEGRVILISSPLGRSGLFFQMFQLGMRGGDGAANMLCIEAPTWEVNPSLPAGEFELQYAKDPKVFFTEFGGRFTDRTLGWIETPSDLFACIDPMSRPRERGLPRQAHYLGLDVGLVNDGTACAIGHVDNGYIVLDYLEQIKAGEGKFANYERLEFDDVAAWIEELSRKFLITKGMFDQYSGIPLEQSLLKRGLRQINTEHFTEMLNSQIYKNFKDMMWDKRLVLYDYTPDDLRELREKDERASEHMPYLDELMTLQATYKSKYVVKVQAPRSKGAHDDRSDALTRMVWVASQNLRDPKYVAGQQSRSPVPGVQQLSAARRRAAMRRNMLGGSHPSRQVHPSGRGPVLRSGRHKG